jgi:hypothetical protein
MYTSPDEARSDLFLAGAVYLFGPVILQVLLQIVPLTRIGIVDTVLGVVQPLLFTLVVPVLLIRYRRESLAMYGLGPGSRGLLVGVLVAAPVALAVLATAVLGGRLLVPPTLTADPLLALLRALPRLASWFGLAGLAVYGTVKARDAFRSDVRPIRAVTLEIGRILAIIAGVATLLLFAVLGLHLELLLVPAGAAGVVYAALRAQRGPSGGASRATLLTPAVLLAIGPFTLFAGALDFVFSVWLASIVAAIGLALGILQETRRSALPAIGLAVTVALLTGL